MNSYWKDKKRIGVTRDSDASINLIKLFSEDDGPKGDETLRQLQLPKKVLTCIESRSPSDSALDPQIVFVLCYLGQDCTDNRGAIESALKEDSPFKDFIANRAAQMLSRLIDKSARARNKGDAREMLGALFELAPKSDSSLWEGPIKEVMLLNNCHKREGQNSIDPRERNRRASVYS